MFYCPHTLLFLFVGPKWSGSGQSRPGGYRHHRCRPGFFKWLRKCNLSQAKPCPVFFSQRRHCRPFSWTRICCQHTLVPYSLCRRLVPFDQVEWSKIEGPTSLVKPWSTTKMYDSYTFAFKYILDSFKPLKVWGLWPFWTFFYVNIATNITMVCVKRYLTLLMSVSPVYSRVISFKR